MALHTIKNSTPTDADPQALPHGVLENLAMRLRPGGLCLMMLRPDGRLAWHDASAGLFFQRYALPLLQYGDGAQEAMRQRIDELRLGQDPLVHQDPSEGLALLLVLPPGSDQLVLGDQPVLDQNVAELLHA